VFPARWPLFGSLPFAALVMLLLNPVAGHPSSDPECTKVNQDLVCNVDIINEFPPYFGPQNMTVLRGATVMWLNHDSTSLHTITSTNARFSDQTPTPNQTFDAGFLEPNRSFEHTFLTPGEFRYYCRVHPWMRGQVTVSNQDLSGTVTVTETVSQTVTVAERVTVRGTGSELVTVTETRTETSTRPVEVTVERTITQTRTQGAVLAPEGLLAVGGGLAALAGVLGVLVLRRRPPHVS